MEINHIKFAQILVDYSMQIKPGDRVAITASFTAEPVLRALFQQVLERGAYPHLLIDLPGQEELLYTYASDDQLEYVPLFHKMAFEEFDVLIKIRTDDNTRALTQFPPERSAHFQKMLASLIRTQMIRGADKSLRWMSTIYPTIGYAMEAEMGTAAYHDFFFRACHADADTPDPVAYWRSVKKDQDKIIARIEGHDQVELRGPNVDLILSVKNRKFVNACGQNNLPDGEVYTGPVEDSANGWVRFTYPAVYRGLVVEGVEMKFEDGKVVHASATKNEALLMKMINSDPGARFLGEFAIGTNYEIDRSTRNILLDEKIGGSFHLALGAGYPETGNTNKSIIHWDMICDMQQDSEIRLDGELIYQNGHFVF